MLAALRSGVSGSVRTMAVRLLRAASASASATSAKSPSSASTKKRRAAIVLSGCGVFDGSEITEAVSCIVWLSRFQAETSFFAPNIAQYHVINHGVGAPLSDTTRNVLSESGRIARGNISPLDKLQASDYDLLVFPGGFGAAKNLSDFATAGADMTLQPDVERVLKAFHAAKRPIALCCIAPVLAARALPGVRVTVGDDEAVRSALRQMGAQPEVKSVLEPCIDRANKVVTVPAYMYGEAAPHEVFDGIGAMLRAALDLA